MGWLVQSLTALVWASCAPQQCQLSCLLNKIYKEKGKKTTNQKKKVKKTKKPKKPPNFFSKRYWKSLQSIHRAEITHRLILYQNQTFLSYVWSACEVWLKLKSKELICIDGRSAQPGGAGPRGGAGAPGSGRGHRARPGLPRRAPGPAAPAPPEPHLPSLLGVLGRLQAVLDGRVDFRGGRPRLDFCFSSSFFSSFSPSSLFCRGKSGFLFMFHCWLSNLLLY